GRVLPGELLELDQQVGQAGRVVVDGDHDGHQGHGQLASRARFRPKWRRTWSRSAGSTGRTTRAGTPAATVQSGTSRVTMAAAATWPTRPRVPCVLPLERTAVAPMMLPAPTVSGPGGGSGRVVLPAVRGGRPRTAPSKTVQPPPRLTPG